MDKDALNKQFDAYIKKTIKNTVINYKKYEERKRHREMSMEELSQDISVPFLFSLTHSLEDYFENEKLYNIVAGLKKEQKSILEMKILNKYNSKQIAKILDKSDSRVRHIYNDTIEEIKNKMKEWYYAYWWTY